MDIFQAVLQKFAEQVFLITHLWFLLIFTKLILLTLLEFSCLFVEQWHSG